MSNTSALGDTDNKLLQKIANNTAVAISGGGGGGVASNVAVTASALPTGASTEATLAALSAKVTAVNTGAVTVSSSALPTGASTEATLAALSAKVTAVNTGAVVVSSSVLPTGASTEATLAALSAKVTAVNTGAVTVSSSVLPTGASTEATLAALSAKVTAVNTGAVTVSSSVLPTGAATEATLSTLNGKVTACNTGAVVISGALPAGTAAIGLVGGKTVSIKDTTAVSTSPVYTAGDAVGGKRTLANALTAVGTGVLESIQLMDRANQSLGLVIYIFDADPAAATITDNGAFVFSTDDLKVLAVIVVATSDWTVTNTKAFCLKNNLGVVLKSAGTSLYAAVVATSTPTFAATTDLQLIFGILQD